MSKKQALGSLVKKKAPRMGRPTRYHGKDRARPMFFAMTAAARDHLSKQAARMGLSKPDYVEGLVRGDIAPTKMV